MDKFFVFILGIGVIAWFIASIMYPMFVALVLALPKILLFFVLFFVFLVICAIAYVLGFFQSEDKKDPPESTEGH